MDVDKVLERFGLKPKYSETVLYVISLTFFLLWVYDESMRPSLVGLLTGLVSKKDEHIALIVFSLLIGIFLPIINVFRTKPNEEEWKFSMIILSFTVFSTIFMSFYTAVYMIETSAGLWIVLPICNIAYCYLFVYLYASGMITVSYIPSRQARILEVVVSTLATLAIFAISQFVLNYHWTVTYSLCITYAIFINDLVVKVITTKKYGTRRLKKTQPAIIRAAKAKNSQVIKAKRITPEEKYTPKGE
ncbi:MAG: hypothetical protein PHG85_01640 [Candidatus Altiarchaeota archaeon]|nr:hypothetical protein [Candidatus Altiarchaeota archaeon]